MFAIICEYVNDSIVNLHIYDLFNKIIENTDSKTVDPVELSKNGGRLKEYLLEKFGCIPEHYITFYGFALLDSIADELSKLTKIVLFNDDIHHSKRIANFRVRPYLRSFCSFNTYGYQLNRWNLPNVNNNYYFPHSARWILDINKEPTNRILVSGVVSGTYPDREYVIKLKHPKIDVLWKRRHDDRKTVFGIDFYKKLNEYICCYVDTAREYTLGKVFEIPASGSLLLCMNPEIKDIFEILGFQDGENYISCTRENILQKIDFILDPKNRTEIDRIRENGQKLIKEKHNYENRYKVFMDVLAGKFIGEKHINKKYGTKYMLGF